MKVITYLKVHLINPLRLVILTESEHNEITPLSLTNICLTGFKCARKLV